MTANLQPPDSHGLCLAPGFTGRLIAASGQRPCIGNDFIWHNAPDAGASFAADDGGWIYVSNGENNHGHGGVSALRFSPQGEIVDAYSILDHANRNCGGGATPWNTWLSGEEVANGIIYECDPSGKQAPIRRRGLGVFTHEGAAVDPQRSHIYLTEDLPDGCLYRFVPESSHLRSTEDLAQGYVEVAVINHADRKVHWKRLPDPSGSRQETRYQVPDSAKFKGAEGIAYFAGQIFFATKGDVRVWRYDTVKETFAVIYDAASEESPILTGVDTIAMTKKGSILVAEDGGNMQIVAITADLRIIPVMQLLGHDNSEVTGPAFSPDGTRLYFSSQRGRSGSSDGGMTFEISGPWMV